MHSCEDVGVVVQRYNRLARLHVTRIRSQTMRSESRSCQPLRFVALCTCTRRFVPLHCRAASCRLACPLSSLEISATLVSPPHGSADVPSCNRHCHHAALRVHPAAHAAGLAVRRAQIVQHAIGRADGRSCGAHDRSRPEGAPAFSPGQPAAGSARPAAECDRCGGASSPPRDMQNG